MIDSVLVEVGGQVFVGVAPLVGAGHPDLLAAQPVAEGCEDAHLVDGAHDPSPATVVGPVQRLSPRFAHNPVDWHMLTDWVVPLGPPGVTADQGDGVDDGPMGGVGRLEGEHIEEFDQPAPVVVGVAGLQGGLHGAPVGGPRRLVLADQVVEGLLADDRVQGVTHNLVGMVDSGLGQPEQDVLLAPDPSELVDQFLGHSPLGPGVDQMYDANQQLGEGVGDLPLSSPHQRGQQGEPGRRRMPTEVTRGFRGRPGSPRGDHFRGNISEQVEWQADRSGGSQLVDLAQHGGQAHPAWVGLDHPQHAPGSLFGFVALIGDRYEGLQAHHRIGSQPGHDQSEEHLLGLMQCRAHDAFNAGPLRRLDAFGPAAGQQLVAYPVGAPLGAGDVASKPVGQLLGLGDTALSEAERPAKLDPVSFDLSPGPVVGADLRRRHTHLAGHVLDGIFRQLPELARETPSPGQELEDHPETQPGCSGLAAQQLQLAGHQREVLDQLVEFHSSGQESISGWTARVC